MGGKGSGRKRKNHGAGNGTAGGTKPAAAAPVQHTQRVTIQQPAAADPFLAVESQINERIPETPAPAAAAGQPVQEQPERKAPEKIIRWLWKAFYGAEDYLGRRALGLGLDYAGYFFQPEIADSHVEPTCKIAIKYLPDRWLDLLNKIEEHSPEFILAGLILESQANFFDKFAAAKRELAANQNQDPTNTKQDPPAAPPQPGVGPNGYPLRNSVG